MSIYDCFIYFDDDLVLDLRLNILDKYVDTFVIVEGKKDHQGNEKKLNFKIEKFEKFKSKIKYVIVEDFPISDYSWDFEHHQRESRRRWNCRLWNGHSGNANDVYMGQPRIHPHHSGVGPHSRANPVSNGIRQYCSQRDSDRSLVHPCHGNDAYL